MVYEQVRRLQIAVNDATIMGAAQPRSRLNDAFHCFRHSQRPRLRNQTGQVAPVNVLHDQEVPATDFVCVIGDNDVRVRQPGRRFPSR